MRTPPGLWREGEKKAVAAAVRCEGGRGGVGGGRGSDICSDWLSDAASEVSDSI